MANNDIITALNRANSPFFRLPPEIRRCVYQYALNEDETVVLFPPCNSRKKPKALTIQLSCRQMYQETSTLYYSVNDLSLRTGWPLGYRRFAPQLGAIKTLCVYPLDGNLSDYQGAAIRYQGAFGPILSLFTALETIRVSGLPITNKRENATYNVINSILGKKLKYSS